MNLFFLRAALRRHAFRNFRPSNLLYKKPSVRCLTKLPELRPLRVDFLPVLKGGDSLDHAIAWLEDGSH